MLKFLYDVFFDGWGTWAYKQFLFSVIAGQCIWDIARPPALLQFLASFFTSVVLQKKKSLCCHVCLRFEEFLQRHSKPLCFTPCMVAGREVPCNTWHSPSKKCSSFGKTQLMQVTLPPCWLWDLWQHWYSSFQCPAFQKGVWWQTSLGFPLIHLSKFKLDCTC